MSQTSQLPSEFFEWHKSQLITRKEALSRGVEPHNVGMAQKYAFKSKYHVEKWYSHVEAFTMQTVCLKLNRKEANILRKAYLKDVKPEGFSELLQKFEKAIEDRFPNGFFVKLNSRSPKDVPMSSPKDEKFLNIVNQSLDELPTNYSDTDLFLALSIGLTKCMHLHSAEEAIDLLTRSHRICEDLGLQGYLPEEMVDVQVIFREWDDALAQNPLGEYRCFVFKNKLTCIGQYFADCYMPELIENKQLIKKSISDYLTNQVIPNLKKIESYVIDVCYISPTELKVIELNPFSPTSGPGLFSWKEDCELFISGSKDGDVEIRVLEEKPEDMMSNFGPRWQTHVQSYLSPEKSGCSCIIS